MAEELNVDKTPGFKVGEKKTIDEYQKLGMCNFCWKDFPASPSSSSQITGLHLSQSRAYAEFHD